MNLVLCVIAEEFVKYAQCVPMRRAGQQVFRVKPYERIERVRAIPRPALISPDDKRVIEPIPDVIRIRIIDGSRCGSIVRTGDGSGRLVENDKQEEDTRITAAHRFMMFRTR